MFKVFVLAEIVFDHTVKNDQLFAFSKLRWILRLHECRKEFWGGFGERIRHYYIHVRQTFIKLHLKW